MKRRNILQVTAAGVGAGMAPWAFAQSPSNIGTLKPGKPYAGVELNLLTVVAPQFKAHEARLAEFEALTGIKVSHVLRGGAGERAGLSPGDEVLALHDWRLRRLDDAQRLLAPGHTASLLVARDQRLLTLKLERPAAGEASGSVTLHADAKASRAALALRLAWIDG
mgnify:CR=1 FL=1